MSRDPRPRILTRPKTKKGPGVLGASAPIDFVAEFADRSDDHSDLFADLNFFKDTPRPYMLTNTGYSPKIVAKVKRRYPLGEAVQRVDVREVLSIGLNGTGEIDIANHHHLVTALLLLQGQKIWALRAPGDRDCERKRNHCTNPFNVCDYYAQPGSPTPACVQNPGETIVVPDAWHHGTCNNASITVGWGGQGRRFQLRFSGTGEGGVGVGQRFATSEEPVIGEKEAKRVEVQLADFSSQSPSPEDENRGHDGRERVGLVGALTRLSGGALLASEEGVSETTYDVFRNLHEQFDDRKALHREEDLIMGDPNFCWSILFSPSSGRPQWSMDRIPRKLQPQNLLQGLVLLGDEFQTLTLTFQDAATGFVVERNVSRRGAAIWRGPALRKLAWRGRTGLGGPTSGMMFCFMPLKPRSRGRYSAHHHQASQEKPRRRSREDPATEGTASGKTMSLEEKPRRRSRKDAATEGARKKKRLEDVATEGAASSRKKPLEEKPRRRSRVETTDEVAEKLPARKPPQVWTWRQQVSNKAGTTRKQSQRQASAAQRHVEEASSPGKQRPASRTGVGAGRGATANHGREEL